jgi:hypothetical protein
MIWGEMCSKGTAKLHRIIGKMDVPMNHSILSRCAAQKLIGNRFIFQQDNDLKHKTIKTMQYFSKKTW